MIGNEISCDSQISNCPFVYEITSKILYKIFMLPSKDGIVFSNCSLQQAHDKLNKLKAFT